MLTDSWVEGKSVEEKDAQPTERTGALWGLSRKIDSRICVNFTRNGLRLGSMHQEPPHTDVSKNLATVTVRGVLPGLRQKKNWTGHLLVLVHCVFWKPTSLNPFTNKFWSTSCFLLLTSFLKMLISFFSRIWHLPTLPKVDWPANSPDLNPIENLWGIIKRKMRNKRPKNADELKATVKETWASIPPQQCHKPITSMSRRIEAVIKAKGAPTKYWVHIQ